MAEPVAHDSSHGFSNIIATLCHGKSAVSTVLLALWVALPASLPAQQAWPAGVRQLSQPAKPRPPQKHKVQPPIVVPEGWLDIQAKDQTREGPWYHLRVAAQVTTDTFLLRAAEIDYNEDTGYVEARGGVYLQHFEDGAELWADHATYDLTEDTGKFYVVRGSAPLQIEARPRILTSTSPFYFEGKWAEKQKEKYILYDGFITNCKMPSPWWRLRGPRFDIIPGERALAYRTVFWLRFAPLFYSPFYYKSLARLPRKSGILTPNIGNSSQRGKMIGGGYYWAFSRSYDAAYRAQYFTQRGFAHNVDFRGKPTGNSSVNFILYGVNDRGPLNSNGTRGKSQGGVMFTTTGRIDFSDQFYGRADINYLSSFGFRQAFTETYTEAISSEVQSTAYLTRQWSTYGLDAVFQRQENFQSTAPNDAIVIRKLPQFEFSSRDRRLFAGLPLWVSWESTGGLLSRSQLAFQTRNFLDRMDVYPRITSMLHWGDFSFVPSFALRETRYGESRENFQILGKNIIRSAREFDFTLVPPSLARVFDAPKWMGDKVKHVIEPEVNYRYVTGVDNFNRLIRFDETELYSNTNEVELGVTNRLYVKRGSAVEEILSWQVKQKRYFDPTFGGAVSSDWCGQTACRNVVLSSIELTPYAFLDGPRKYSPVVSILRASPKPGFGIEWRSDYDPLRSKVVNTSLSVDGRLGIYSVSIGNISLRTAPALAPPANQFRGDFRMGSENRRGWNAGFSAIYDFRTGILNFATTGITYNTNCCGFSAQYRRFSFGPRNENQFRVAFAVANVGNFGTLKKQERMF